MGYRAVLGRLQVALWYPWRRLESRLLRVSRGQDEQVYVVLGYPRSGTSTLCSLLAAAGISFGDPVNFRRPDWRNSDGYFEHVATNTIDTALMQQSRSTSMLTFSAGSGVEAKGLIRRLWRGVTRFRMLLLLGAIRRYAHKEGSGKWAIKLFPTPFYFWKQYVPHARVIAVYRDPLSSAHSMRRSFGKLSFAQYIDEWTRAHEELLSHVLLHSGLLIALSDISDASKRPRVIAKLAAYVGVSPEAIAYPLEQREQTSRHRAVEVLTGAYPLPQRTQEVYAALQKLSDEHSS